LFGNGTPYIDEGYDARFTALDWKIERTKMVNYMTALQRPGVLVVGRR
jgi:hypothetical protein